MNHYYQQRIEETLDLLGNLIQVIQRVESRVTSLERKISNLEAKSTPHGLNNFSLGK